MMQFVSRIIMNHVLAVNYTFMLLCNNILFLLTDFSMSFISSQDFVMGLSILLRGTVQEKLNWAFNLYDINKDGYITKEVIHEENQ